MALQSLKGRLPTLSYFALNDLDETGMIEHLALHFMVIDELPLVQRCIRLQPISPLFSAGKNKRVAESR